MAEYIERYALLDDFYTASRNPWPDFDDAWKLVQNAPSVDIAPVVRCKDCKYSKPKGEIYECPFFDEIRADEYCSSGERRDET